MGIQQAEGSPWREETEKTEEKKKSTADYTDHTDGIGGKEGSGGAPQGAAIYKSPLFLVRRFVNRRSLLFVPRMTRIARIRNQNEVLRTAGFAALSYPCHPS